MIILWNIYFIIVIYENNNNYYKNIILQIYKRNLQTLYMILYTMEFQEFLIKTKLFNLLNTV